MISASVMFAIVAIIASLIGAAGDIKTRIVPDWTNYFMILFGLGGHLLVSIYMLSYWPIVASIIGAALFYAIAHAMFYTGQWGGGDAKMFIGFGAILPLTPITAHYLAPWPFLFTLWLNILLVGAAYGLITSFWLAAKYRAKFSKESKKLLNKYRYVSYLLSVMFVIPIALFVTSTDLFAPLALAWAGATVLFYIFILAKAVESACMYKRLQPSKLVEGDWITKDVRIAGKLVYSAEREGVSREAIAKLQQLERQSKLRTVLVKEGMPFIPAFFAGLLVSIFYGDIFFVLLMTL